MNRASIIVAEAVVVFALPISAAGESSAEIHIIACPGNHPSIEEAATSECTVNFWDEDPTDDDACTECFAAVELRRYLVACTGMPLSEVKLHWTNELPKDGHVFVIGNSRSNPHIESFPTEGDGSPILSTAESFRIRVIPRESGSVCIIEGKSRIGTLYGVYAYLRRLGIRFFGLGEQGTVYPSGKVSIPLESLDVVENPAFLTRGFYAWENRGNEEFFLWMAHNRMNYWTSAEEEIHLLKKLGMRLSIGAHDVQSNFLDPAAEYPYESSLTSGSGGKPADPYKPSSESKGDTNGDGKLSYFEAHPEWYGLRDGERIGEVGAWSHGKNICTSNDDAVAELAGNFTQGLTDGVWRYADDVNFWMIDGAFWWCECENCTALGTPTDQLLRLLYKVNKEVRIARKDGRLERRVHLTTLAYTDTLSPPTRPLPSDFDYDNCSVTFYPIQRCYVHPLNDPDCDEGGNNGRYATEYLKWATRKDGHYQGAMFMGEYYNVSNYRSLPVLYTRIMAVDIPWYYRTGCRHFQYMHVPTSQWGTWTLNQYMLASLLWDPGLNVDALLNDYFERFYPITNANMRAFHDHLEDAFRNITLLKTYLPIHLNANRSPFSTNHFRYSSKGSGPSLLETIESLRLARADIDAAFIECDNPVEISRLLEDERRFAYGEDMVRFYYHLARTAIFDESGKSSLAEREFAKVERAAADLQQYGKDLVVSFVKDTIGIPYDGLDATQALKKYRLLKEQYGGASKGKIENESKGN